MPHACHDLADVALVGPLSQDVLELDRRPRGCRPSDRPLPDAERRSVQRLGQLVVKQVGSPDAERSIRLVILVDHAAVRPGKLDRMRDDRREHLLKVQARADCLADLAERLKLADASL